MARLAELGRRRRPSRCSDLLPRARGGAVARDRCCRPGRSPHAWHRDRERRKEGDEPREKDGGRAWAYEIIGLAVGRSNGEEGTAPQQEVLQVEWPRGRLAWETISSPSGRRAWQDVGRAGLWS